MNKDLEVSEDAEDTKGVDSTTDDSPAKPALAPADEQFMPDPLVERRYNVSDMTITRWDQDPALDFPKAVVIRGRKYRRLSELLKFEERMARDPQVTRWTPRGCVGASDEAA